ncbi:hypothetical protein [Clostridium tagluense]|uniref:hypothetical protein n=1 Tax=Clostridium tagluense TaxID=360422 RepID=UPI001CF27D16|nr:hypothetical protein [Clostridium tagluense]MCB2300034.1 hypothetical protein [Clostridium tagluense]
MKKVFLIMILIFCSLLYSLKPMAIDNTKNPFLTIMFNTSSKTYYYKYDLKTNTYKTIYYKGNNGYYSDGIAAKGGSALYYTDRVNGNYNLYKIKINGKPSDIIQLTKNIKIDMFCLGDNKIFCRARQKINSNNSIAILNLLNNKLNVCYKEENDTDVFKLEHNQFTNKIYTIESSIEDRNTFHLPNLPLNKIIEYDENGNRIKELFQMKGFYFLAINSDSKVLLTDKQHVERTRSIYYYDLTTKKTSKIFNKIDGFVIKSMDL